MSKTYSKPVKIRRSWKATGKTSRMSTEQLEKEKPRCRGRLNDSIFNSDHSLRDDYWMEDFDRLKVGKTPLRNQHLLSKQVRADYNRDSSIDCSPFSLSTVNHSSAIDVIDSQRRSTPIIMDKNSKPLAKRTELQKVEMPHQPKNSLIVETSISSTSASNNTRTCLKSSKTKNTTTRTTKRSKKFSPIKKVYFNNPNNNNNGGDGGFLQAVANISPPPCLSINEPDESSDYPWKVRMIVEYNCGNRNKADLEGNDSINYDGFLEPLRNSNNSNVGNCAEAVAKPKGNNRVEIVPKKLSFSPTAVNISNKTDATTQTLSSINNSVGSSSTFSSSPLSEEAVHDLTTSVIFATISQTDDLSISLPAGCDSQTETEIRKATTHLMKLLTKSFDKTFDDVEEASMRKLTTTERSSSTDKSETNSLNGNANSLLSSGIDVNSSGESSLISNPPKESNDSSRTPAEILLRRNPCTRKQLPDCRIIDSVSYTASNESNVTFTESEESHPRKSFLSNVICRLRESVAYDSPTEAILSIECSPGSVGKEEKEKSNEVNTDEVNTDEVNTDTEELSGMRRTKSADDMSSGKIGSRRRSTRLTKRIINYSELSDDDAANEAKGTVNRIRDEPFARMSTRRRISRYCSCNELEMSISPSIEQPKKSCEQYTTVHSPSVERFISTDETPMKTIQRGRGRPKRQKVIASNIVNSPSVERFISTDETPIKTTQRGRGRPKRQKVIASNKPKRMPKLQAAVDPNPHLEMTIFADLQESSVILPAKRKRVTTPLKRRFVLKDIKNTRNVAAPTKMPILKPILSEDKAQTSVCDNIGIYCDRAIYELVKPLTIRVKKIPLPNVPIEIPDDESEINLSNSSQLILRVSPSESIASTDSNSIDYLTRKRKTDSQSLEQPAIKLSQHSLDDEIEDSKRFEHQAIVGFSLNTNTSITVNQSNWADTLATTSSNATANQTCLDDSIDRNNFIDAIAKGAAQFNQLSRVNQSVGAMTVNRSKSGRKNSNELTQQNTHSTMSRRLSKSVCDVIMPLDEELEDNDNVNLSESIPSRLMTDSQRNSLRLCSNLQKSSIVAANMAVSLEKLPEDSEASLLEDTFTTLRPGKWRKSWQIWRREKSIILDKTNSTDLRLQQRENQNSTIAKGSFMLLPQSRSEEHIEGDREDSRVLLLEPTDDGTLNHQSISLLEQSQSRQQKSASVAVESIVDIAEKSSTFRNFNDSESTHDIRQIYQQQLSVPSLYRQPSVPRRRRTSVIEPGVVGRSQHSGAGDQLLLFNEFIHEPYENRLRPVLSARDRVLRQCNQSEPLDFDIEYSESNLHQCRKIGEGVYGEVFMNKKRSGEVDVLKIIPIEGHIEINGESQKKFDEIESEIVIGIELSRLRGDKQFMTGGFVEVKKVCCVKGRYPEHLVEQWELYRDNHPSENDHPEIFPDEQHYIVLELANGGQDLEAFTFANALQSLSAFLQTALTLAVAEQKFQFEHRDLHWGNILLAPTDVKEIVFRLDDNEIKIPSCGVKATIIDYTLSRMVFKGCRLYNDLSNDSELFLAAGDYQFDIYRLMKQHVNNQWDTFEPYTNTLWLHYTIDKMINGARYRSTKTKKHRDGIQELMRLRDEFLEHKSAYDYAECLKYDMASTLSLLNNYK